MILSSFIRTILMVPVFLSLLGSNAFAEPVFIPDQLKSSSVAPEPNGESWVLMEANTGWLLSAQDPEKQVEPASLTKLMTAYIVFELLDKGQYSANDLATISTKAWKAPGSRMFAQVDTAVPLGELLKGLIIQSGNDAAVALAEHIGGTEDGFAIMMNQKAADLGLHSTHYVNASGLPAPGHLTTALDTALLSRAIIRDYPGFYHMFSIKRHTYNDIEQPNRNNLLWRHDSYDGLKTGYTKAAGYCLAGSAKRDNTRFIAVVMGSESKKTRVQAVQSLIEFGFAKYESAVVFSAIESVHTLPLYKSEQQSANVGVNQTVSVLLPRGRRSELQIEYALPAKLLAPLSTRSEVGKAKLSFNGLPLGTVKLYPTQNYPAGSLWSQLLGTIRYRVDWL
ncbi:MAG: D-alanyl-D-alanine carboxypeptidase (penicillin-binding protein 5/6) [Saprospiraceae bacterium]|jgi:D-alanyl-D-alanine carboxypeptidase (penicillin-binding protein 5/6)